MKFEPKHTKYELRNNPEKIIHNTHSDGIIITCFNPQEKLWIKFSSVISGWNTMKFIEL